MVDKSQEDCARFLEQYAETFENSPWVAEAAWDKGPFESVASIHQAMCDAVLEAPREFVIGLLRAHPDLAGKEAQAGTMTDSSTEEQSGAGLNSLTAQEIQKITHLNKAYREKFDFPFIIAVRNNAKAQIFDQFEKRLLSDPETEIKNALEQIFTITKLRLNLDVT